MMGKAIILLGDYRDIRRQIQATVANRRNTTYYPSLFEHSSKELEETNASVSSVLRKELERDEKEVIPALRSGMNAVIEEWHLGNWAIARSVKVTLEEKHIQELRAHILQIAFPLSVIYVSWSDMYLLDSDHDIVDEVSGLARQIAFVLKYFDIEPMTVNSDVPDEMIQARLEYLFNVALGLPS